MTLDTGHSPSRELEPPFVETVWLLLHSSILFNSIRMLDQQRSLDIASKNRSKNDWIVTATVPWLGGSAWEAESPLANVVERLDSEHELAFWMRSE